MDPNQLARDQEFRQKKAHLLQQIAALEEKRKKNDDIFVKQQVRLDALDADIARIRSQTPRFNTNVQRKNVETLRRLADTAMATIQQNDTMYHADAAFRYEAGAKQKETLDEVDEQLTVAENPERRVAYEAELAENIQRIRMELTELDEKYVTILAETKRVQAEKRRKKEVTDAVLADVTLRLEGARELRDKKRAELAGVKEMNDRNRFTLKLLNENFAKMSLPKDNK